MTGARPGSAALVEIGARARAGLRTGARRDGTGTTLHPCGGTASWRAGTAVTGTAVTGDGAVAGPAAAGLAVRSPAVKVEVIGIRSVGRAHDETGPRRRPGLGRAIVTVRRHRAPFPTR